MRSWARQKRDGVLRPSDPKTVTYAVRKAERAQIDRLENEVVVLKRQLAQSESAVEVLGKASELLTALAKSSQLHQATAREQIPETFRSAPPGGSGSLS